MYNNVRTLEVFNTLEAFKRKEYKLVKKSIACFCVTAGVTIASTTFLPETAAIIPTVAVGGPSMFMAFKSAREADKASNNANIIFDENKDEIMNFKINSATEHQEFTKQFPTISKHFARKFKNYSVK